MRIITLLLLFFIATISEANAEYKPARIRSDGNLIDGSGNIVAVRNESDSRTNKHEFYYYGIEEGQLTSESKYKLMYHPEEVNGGLVMIDLEEEANKKRNQQVATGSKVGTTTTYNLNINKSRYDTKDAYLKPRY